MKRGVEIAATVFMVVYPLGVWAGISMGGGRAVGVVVLVSLTVGGIARRRVGEFGWGLAPLVLLPGLALLSIVLDRERLLFAGPVVMNVILLATFASSLPAGRTPIVERFARAMDGELSPGRIAYCRTVTIVWCGFFVINGSIALWLALYGSLSAWGLYTGGIAYGLIGLLFAAEYAVRRLKFG